MNCPYCISAIPDEALSCSFCTKDLYLFKPLLQKIASLEETFSTKQAVADLQEKVAQLERTLAENAEALQSSLSSLSSLSPDTEAPQPAPAPKISVLRRAGVLLGYFLLPLMLLLLTHYLIGIRFNLPVLYLRIASLLIPVPFGLLVLRHRHTSFGNWTMLSAVMALFAVFAMSYDTSLADHTPVLPQSLLELREFVEYAFSIWISFLTGMILNYVFLSRRRIESDSPSYKLIAILKKTDIRPENIQKKAQQLQSIGGTLVSIGTTAMAIYSGLKGVIGN